MGSRGLVLSLLAALVLAPASGAAQGQGTGTAAPAPAEWLQGDLRLRLDTFQEAEIQGTFDVHQALVQGSARSAQALREAYRQAAVLDAEDDFVAGIEGALRERLEGALRTLFPTAEPDVGSVVLDRSSLLVADGPSPHHPPLVVRFEASVGQGLGDLADPAEDADVAAERVRGALELGAVARFPQTLAAPPGWNVTYTFEAPSWARIAEAPGGSLGAGGSTVAWTLRNWRGTTQQHLPVDLEVRARSAPATVEASDVRVEVSLDMAAVEGLTLPGLLAKDFGRLLVHFEARVVAQSLRFADFPVLESALQERLPPGLVLDGLTAEGVRSALRQGLLPATALASVEQPFRRLAEERLSSFGATEAELRGGFEETSLSAASGPLVYHLSATFRLPLATGAEASRVQALAVAGPVLLERSLSFELPRLQGLDTTYRLVLPPGIALTDVQVRQGEAEQATQEGRDVLVVTPEGERAQATLTIAVTAGFVLAQFWYLGVVSVFLAAGAFAARWLRRRPRKPSAAPAVSASAPAASASAAAVAPVPPRAEPGNSP